MSTVKIQGYNTLQVEFTIYKLFASSMINKFDATGLPNTRRSNNRIKQCNYRRVICC